MSRVRLMNESCRTYVWVVSHVSMCYMSRVWMRHVTRMNAYRAKRPTKIGLFCNRDSARHCKTLQHTATHCNTLQHTATHRNTLQHTATHRKAQCRLHHANSPTIVGLFCKRDFETRCNTLQHTATNCNTLQHTMQTTSCKEPYNNRALLRKRSSLDLLRERDFSQKRSFVKET